MSTGFVYHEDYLKHETGVHPESKDRLVSIMNALKERQLLERLVKIEPVHATEKQIEYAHEKGYIEHVRSTCEREGYLDLDTPVSRGSYNAAFLAAGGLIKAVDSVMNSLNNAFALVRPPGHHAEPDRGMGFCLFNNVAIAAHHLRKEYGMERILIVDWDVHHGNGTQEMFYDDPCVLYFSTHQYPHYPGTGRMEEVGMGEGEGYTVNVPLPAGTGDSGYLYVFKEILFPIAMDFNPEFILVSAGFDPHHADPLASMNLTSKCFGEFTRILMTIAEKKCDGRMVITLEGGYDLKALSFSVLHVFNSLGNLGVEIGEPYSPPRDSIKEGVAKRIEEVKKIQEKYWQLTR
ncbi:MAG: histone deacetylase family protein [Candidatus Syntropharchaeia archaeon]